MMFPLMLSAKSVKIRLIDNDNNQPIFGFPVVLPNSVDTDVDKFLLITTTAQYRHISETDFKPYQFDNGDDYVRCERYRIVDKEGRIGYANPQGYVIIEPKYAFGFPFENGKAKVTDSGQEKEVEGSNGEYHYWDSEDWYYIDQLGNRIVNYNE